MKFVSHLWTENTETGCATLGIHCMFNTRLEAPGSQFTIEFRKLHALDSLSARPSIF